MPFLSNGFLPVFSHCWHEEPSDAFRWLLFEHLSLPLSHHWLYQGWTLDFRETSPEIGLIQLVVPSAEASLLGMESLSAMQWSQAILAWSSRFQACVLWWVSEESSSVQKGKRSVRKMMEDPRPLSGFEDSSGSEFAVSGIVKLPWTQLINTKDTLTPAYCILCLYDNGLNELMSFTTTCALAAHRVVRELLMGIAVTLLCLVHCLAMQEDYGIFIFLIKDSPTA